MDQSKEQVTADGGGTVGSKLVVTALFLWIGIFGVGTFLKSMSPPEGSTRLVSPFKPWDGNWEGEFSVTNAKGEVITRLNVKQRYRHVMADERFEQEGHFEVTNLATGEMEIEKALNSSEFDGTGMHCKVFKKNGAVVEEHVGRFEGEVLIWSRDESFAKEEFREWIEGDVYFIEGEGMYGDLETAEALTMHGEYKRVVAE